MSLWRRIYTEQRAVVLPLLLILIANLAVLLLAELPLSHSVTGLKNEAVSASLKMSRARVTEQRAKEARASKERADQDLRKFYAETLPADLTSARHLIVGSFLQRTARDVGLTFQRGSVEQVDVKDSQLQELTGKVTLVGDYQNIRRFLYAVETAREFLVVERVALSQATDLKAGNTGALEVTLDVATYYLGAR
jgi:Tfp pilus assembly protein PilO